ncbi:hypothetical protein LCGC14_1465280 [marine sediment metagenome]|uniref:HNH nuclease domain-containing protein n=1 Tax=marine sediment metagenome TaxID=412755 RepID=A0A0F9JEH1_9ZZZZ
MPTQTLVLSQSYTPLKVVSWQRAVTLLFQGKVEVVEEYEDHIRSTFLVIKMPAVVRLINAFRRRKKPVKFSRINIYGRDKYKCQYCGEKVKLENGTYDHVVPRAQGGKTVWKNIVTACEPCNSRKANRTPEQAGMRLRLKPIQPKAVPIQALRLRSTSAPDQWVSYMYWTGVLDE